MKLPFYFVPFLLLAKPLAATALDLKLDFLESIPHNLETQSFTVPVSTNSGLALHGQFEDFGNDPDAHLESIRGFTFEKHSGSLDVSIDIGFNAIHRNGPVGRIEIKRRALTYGFTWWNDTTKTENSSGELEPRGSNCAFDVSREIFVHNFFRFSIGPSFVCKTDDVNGTNLNFYLEPSIHFRTKRLAVEVYVAHWSNGKYYGMPGTQDHANSGGNSILFKIVYRT